MASSSACHDCSGKGRSLGEGLLTAIPTERVGLSLSVFVLFFLWESASGVTGGACNTLMSSGVSVLSVEVLVTVRACEVVAGTNAVVADVVVVCVGPIVIASGLDHHSEN